MAAHSGLPEAYAVYLPQRGDRVAPHFAYLQKSVQSIIRKYVQYSPNFSAAG